MSFSPDELSRYARHIVLREIGGPGQAKLKAARVLIVGVGGLGSPAALYLAASGVGTLGLFDDDVVSLSNLQRQILHDTAAVGISKVVSGARSLARINPHIAVEGHEARLTPQDGADIVQGYDLVLDGTDNFDSRYVINRLCVAAKVPLISAAMTQWEGQISLYDPARGGPCYGCVFPQAPDADLAPSCAEAGVIGALGGVMGSMMAMEAIKHLTGAGETLDGSLLLYDALYAETRRITVKRDPSCAACN